MGVEGRKIKGPGAGSTPKTLVRCLGPGPEHRFKSLDPRYNRICAKCQSLIGRQSQRASTVPLPSSTR